MRLSIPFFIGFTLVSLSDATTLEKRQTANQITTVNLADNTGTPAHLASGFIYGIPNTLGQIPNSFYQNIGFNYGRASGAQLAEPARGWIFGLTEFKNRFESAVANYDTARTFNAKFVILMNDLWGADGTQPAGSVFPGDDGDWDNYNSFLVNVIAGINSNNMFTGVAIDIWNEPDAGTAFWNGNQEQWLTMWNMGYETLRSAFGTTIELFGPTLAGAPETTNTWWTTFLAQIASSNTIPDAYVWHLEGSVHPNDDLQTNIPILDSMLSQHGLGTKPIVIDEYGVFAEQCPGGSAWWISRLERFNVPGLRGNWLSGTELHDFMASLLWKPDPTDATATGYFTNGDYQVYQYYNLNMTGHRVATTGSIDRLMDSYATVGTDKVRILVGGRQVTGTWQVTVDSLSTVGLPTSGTLDITTWQFSFTGSHTGDVGLPTNLGVVAHTYSGNSVSFPIFQTDTTTTWAFEFNVA
ncbi:glycoside hydrolase family 39 protein [Rhodocollybia butyracea]|uniref:Glycoside hydrolase family 39 protein n=1 Tax=Rhodocollybia butyracea TaxID=206335 RepID=A0A9P5PNB6_9AGAR|nr:glycoside hydrolase family 39 protein [Rhodocollybia butyracea]